MSKLTGYKAVAVIKQGYAFKHYHFAIYDDGFDYQPGDKVILSNSNDIWTIKPGDKVILSNSNDIWTINEIITPEEATARYNKNITAEVVCKVDTNSYDKRVQKRKAIEKLKRDMDKKIKEMDETARYNKNITAEVVCKVDTNSYDKRVQKRKAIEKLKRDMDKKIKEMDESKKYEMYAAENPDLKNMLEAYKALVNEE